MDRPIRWIAGTLVVGAGLATAPAYAGPIGPTPYLQASDSPIAGSGYAYFHLDNLEDGALNTPGVSASGPGLCYTPINCFGGLQDSVDADDGAVDGFGRGTSLWTSGTITLTFSSAVLGNLPNAVGLVWTDGGNPITFEAFDQNNVSLGTIVGNHADGSFSSQTAEDRFYGWTVNSGGILRVVVSNPAGLEVDHIQYGFRPLAASVPEPATLGLLAFGVAATVVARRRRRH